MNDFMDGAIAHMEKQNFLYFGWKILY